MNIPLIKFVIFRYVGKLINKVSNISLQEQSWETAIYDTIENLQLIKQTHHCPTATL